MSEGQIMEKRIKEAYLGDLEYIKDLLEGYNKGDNFLADVWDFVSVRIDALRE